MSRFLNLGALVALISVAQPASAQSLGFTAAQRADGEAQVQAAAKSIASTVRDPSSVTFRNVFIRKRTTPHGEAVSLCGEVTGRNGFGGLTGFQAFTLVNDDVYVGTAVGFAVRDLCFNNQPVIDTRDYTPEITAAYKAAAGI